MEGPESRHIRFEQNDRPVKLDATLTATTIETAAA